MSAPHERAQLYARLQEVLGDRPASTLMTLLPPSDDVTTRTDLAATEGRLVARMDGLDMRMDRLDERMDRLDERMNGLEKRMDRFDERMDRFEDKLDGLHESLRGYSRTFIAAQTASTFGVAGIVLAITQIL